MAACREIVEGDDRMAPGQQMVGQVGGDEAGASGDEDAHLLQANSTLGERSPARIA
jgi:hypothetical protein